MTVWSVIFFSHYDAYCCTEEKKLTISGWPEGE